MGRKREAPSSAWVKQIMGLAHVVQTEALPAPIAVSWDPYTPRLGVQIMEESFRPWLEAISSPVVESKPGAEGTTHLYAQGPLRHCRMVSVQVVAVCHRLPEGVEA